MIRPQTTELHDYRGFAGRIASGTYRKGQKVAVLPAGIETSIDTIESNGKELGEASGNMPVIMHLKDDVDVSRG
ncbi:UNVERIFIED_CONTAM: sulfate adenylyltransferase, partial [Salmonella enterica subsp. enterica serovar Weltevreden]